MEQEEKLFNSRGKEIPAKKYYQPRNSIKDLFQLVIVVVLSFLPVAANIYLFKNIKPEIKIIAPAPNTKTKVDLTEEEKAFSERFADFWEEHQEQEQKDQIKEKKEENKPWRRKH